ncbi:Mitochondrial F1F0-ATP synthase, subunit OSCP/ATP5 [Phaffia rhodozyma]|uniref:ATP synthase subunit 5, mitochondrial n=1 Tax=Phaffia rhodozyma TaxID=264483 RepID=A0A0F7SL48_PHARH|nr:Mitochondrial F1F0-ATP synthase, subunit OSCP/ATP5 [Phaffia rhodozyma]
MFAVRSAVASSIKRSYATTAKVTPPLQLQSLSGKYATAAFTGALSQSSQTLAQVQKDLAALAELIQKKDKSVAFLENPTISSQEREANLKAIFSKIPKASEISSNLLSVLSANGRLTSTSEVLKDFETLFKAHNGELEVIVTSAEPLEKAVQTRLETALKGSESAKGKTLKIVNRVNPSILGGLIVDFGDKTLDLSASTKVNKLNALLAESV